MYEKTRQTIESNLFEKINKNIKIDFNKTNDNVTILSNVNKSINIIDNITPSFESLIAISKQLNRSFESLIDDIEYTTFIGEEFHVSFAMEGIIDSVLVGNLRSGYRNDCFYLKGWGHEKEYFQKRPEKSYIELLVGYTVLIAYNDDTLIEMMEKILGKEMSDLLKSSLNSMFCEENENVDYKKR